MRLSVAVNDSKAGGEFCVELRERERALDVFHHPRAYAAYQGTEIRAAAAHVTYSTAPSV
jgi:hypothetical protein